mgnify:CR=1 FL=1
MLLQRSASDAPRKCHLHLVASHLAHWLEDLKDERLDAGLAKQRDDRLDRRAALFEASELLRAIEGIE